MKKAAYSSPVLRAHGRFEAVTKAGACPANLDFDFSQGVPSASVTCS